MSIFKENPGGEYKPLEKYDTVGEAALDLQKKADEKINPIDLQREIHKGNKQEDSFENQVRLAVERGAKEIDGDFFIVVLFKKERLLQNIIRQYFFPRKSCPTPEYDQIVYKFFKKEEKLEFIWVIPDKATVKSLPLVAEGIPPDQKELFQFVQDFRSGKLDKLCEKLNKNLTHA